MNSVASAVPDLVPLLSKVYAAPVRAASGTYTMYSKKVRVELRGVEGPVKRRGVEILVVTPAIGGESNLLLFFAITRFKMLR